MKLEVGVAWHEMCVRVNGDKIQGSPFRVVVYPDPTQLHQPVRVIEGGTVSIRSGLQQPF